MENQQSILPKSLSRLHQSFLIHPRYKIFWEMHLVHLLFYGAILNLVAFLTLKALVLSGSSTANGAIWSFRLIAILLGIYWLRHTFRHYPEKEFGQISSFLLRTRFLIYFGGLIFLFLPMEFINISPYSTLVGIIGTLLSFHGSILLCLLKSTNIDILVSGILLAVPTFLILGILSIFSISVISESPFLFILSPPVTVCFFMPLFIFKTAPNSSVIDNLLIPFAAWQVLGALSGLMYSLKIIPDEIPRNVIVYIFIASCYSLYIWFIPQLQIPLIQKSVRPAKENLGDKKDKVQIFKITTHHGV